MMPSSSTANNNTFSVDTKGCCFVCLKSMDDTSVQGFGSESATTLEAVYSFRKLSKFLDLNYHKIFNVSVPMLSTKKDLEAEVYVSLCRGCAGFFNYFIDRHNQLERLKIQMMSTLRSFANIMHEADLDAKRVFDYKQKQVAGSPVELVNVGIAAAFRREFKEKCFNQKLKNKQNPKALPVQKQRTHLNQNQFNIPRFPLPGLMPITPILPRSTSMIPCARPKPPTARRQGAPVGSRMRNPLRASAPGYPPQQQPQHSSDVLVVDLDDSDTETQTVDAVEDEEDGLGLVISSVSGANGQITSIPASLSTEEMRTKPPTPPNAVQLNSKVTLEQRLPVNSGGTCPISVPSSTTASISETGVMDHNNSMPTEPAINSDADSFLESLLTPLGAKPPPLSRLAKGSQYIGNEIGIEDTFRIFDNGKCQCLTCGKIVSNGYRENHKLIHLNSKPIKCIYCPTRFRSTPNLKLHVLCFHRANMLASFKNENISFALFEQIVKALFQKIVIKKENEDRPWCCKYCEKDYKNKPDLDAHLTQMHSDHLGNELKQMQETSPIGRYNNESESGMMLMLANTNTEDKGEIAKADNTNSQQQQKCESPLSKKALMQDSLSNQQRPLNPDATSNLKLKCRICGKICMGKNLLRRHVLYFHSNIKNANSSSHNNTPGKNPTQGISSCQYCSRKFKFSHSLRLHVFNSHRLEAFRGYFPPDASEQSINSVVNQLLLAEYKEIAPDTYCCNFCSKVFSQKEFEEFKQNHILLHHFDAFVLKLKGSLQQKDKNHASLLHNGDLGGNKLQITQCERPLRQSSLPQDNGIKIEEVVSILPD